MALQTVAVVVPKECALFELGIIAEVFGIDRSGDGVPAFDFRVCAERAHQPIDVVNGVQIVAPYDLSGLRGADLVCMPAYGAGDCSPAILDALRGAHAAGATLLSVCSGAFAFGQAGLLDGRDCTTHWRYADQLAKQFPTARVHPEVLFVDEGDLITSAGTASGIDACLHLVRRELGAEVATTIARRMVVPPQRDGGQQQYVATPVPEVASGSLSELLDWLQEHLAEDHSVTALADRAAMSARTFARKFRAETGTTPARWLLDQRLHAARRFLETSDLTIEQIASRVGLGSGALLRHHFQLRVGVPPTAYRRSFGPQVTQQCAG